MAEVLDRFHCRSVCLCVYLSVCVRGISLSRRSLKSVLACGWCECYRQACRVLLAGWCPDAVLSQSHHASHNTTQPMSPLSLLSPPLARRTGVDEPRTLTIFPAFSLLFVWHGPFTMLAVVSNNTLLILLVRALLVRAMHIQLPGATLPLRSRVWWVLPPGTCFTCACVGYTACVSIQDEHKKHMLHDAAYNKYNPSLAALRPARCAWHSRRVLNPILTCVAAAVWGCVPTQPRIIWYVCEC